MAGRPLRPATDRSLGEPLPHQPANRPRAPLQTRGRCRSPALTTIHHQVPLRYAVLARLSASYSPPGGRLPTCYSPGRHSTHPRRSFRVRLACVRHAASVDSEPGSNSQSLLLIESGISPIRPFFCWFVPLFNSSESLVRYTVSIQFSKITHCPTASFAQKQRPVGFLLDLALVAI